MNFNITILGSNAATPSFDRHPTAQVLHHHNELMLIDCGEGTQMRLADFNIKRGKLNRIFISHLHGDHFYGLVGLLSTLSLNQRKQPITIYGPAPLESYLTQTFQLSGGALSFPIHFVPTNPEKGYHLLDSTKYLDIYTIPLDHRVPCTGFIFKEKQHPRKFLIEKVKALGIHVSQYSKIKAGEDVLDAEGNTVLNADITKDGKTPRSYAYLTDTSPIESLTPYYEGCDLMYHETTFMADQSERAKATFHTTTKQAANLAKRANAKRLIVGHFSSRYEDLTPLLNECKATFPNTDLAIEGTVFEIPFVD